MKKVFIVIKKDEKLKLDRINDNANRLIQSYGYPGLSSRMAPIINIASDDLLFYIYNFIIHIDREVKRQLNMLNIFADEISVVAVRDTETYFCLSLGVKESKWCFQTDCTHQC